MKTLPSFRECRWTLAYSASVIGLLFAFKYYPFFIELSPGVTFTPWTIAVGVLFVLRDYCQREIGHWVWGPMLVAIFLSWAISPEYGLAVIIGGISGAMADWAVYSFLKKPFHQRILISSLFSGPADTIGFFLSFDLLSVMPGISIFNLPTVIIGSLSKVAAAVFLWAVYRKETPSTP